VCRVRTAVLGVVVSLLWGTGCAAPLVSLREGPREYVATDYENVLDRWTRSGSLFSLPDLETYLNATATYESWDFRWAYTIRYGSDYRLTVEQRSKLLETAQTDYREHHAFFVALSGGAPRDTDLSQPNSAWIVRLIDDTGSESAPEEIKLVRRPTVIDRAYFPYVSPWRQVFRIRFPRNNAEGRPTIAPEATWFGLRFAGAQGNTELRWELERKK
jgi:hypothetical protein